MPADVPAAELDYVQIDRKLVERAVEVLDFAKKADLKVVTAESCTGGLVTAVLKRSARRGGTS
jgi:nicotinamide mononucleotide (NMN) deamidase PncC